MSSYAGGEVAFELLLNLIKSNKTEDDTQDGE